MKKIIKLVLVVALLVSFPLSVAAKNKVNVYLFKREGCGYCANALTFFNALSGDAEYKEYFNFVIKDVSNSDNNRLMETTAKKFNITLKGVPFIVIGDRHFEGYVNTFDDSIKEAIKYAYENESVDMVASEVSDDSSAVTILILIVVVAGIAFLIYMAKDSDSEEVVKSTKSLEEKRSPKATKSTTKKVTKTTTKKKTPTKKKTNKK